MKIIIWGGSFHNKGAEAMSITTIEELKNNNDNTEFYFVSERKSYELDSVRILSLKKNFNITQIKHPTRFKFILFALLPKSIVKLTKENELFTALKQSNYAIDISGFNLSDKIGWKAAMHYYSKVKMCKKFRIKYVVFPQAMGPFNSFWVRYFAKKTIDLIDLIIARDYNTKNYINNLKVKNKDVKLLPDVAFCFKDKYFPKLKSYEKKNTITIAICPNQRAYSRAFNNDNNKYMDIVVNLIKSIPKEANLLFIPHEFGNNSFDDLDLCNDIIKCINTDNYKSVKVVNEIQDAYQLKNEISKSDIVIASRFHSAVGALSLGIPTITIGWADKYPQLLKLFNCEEFSVDVDSCDLEELANKFYYMLSNRELIAKKIENNLITVKEESKKTFKIFKDFVEFQK